MQVSGPMTENADLNPGTRLGPYEILYYLANGGMTRIYKARHADSNLERALKVLDSDADQDTIDAIRWEAGIGPRVSQHPNVVSVHELGQQDGLYYLSMDLVNGASLDKMLERGDELPLNRILGITSDVANGLAHVHKNHIVHSDVKPGNILVDNTRAFISDFGIAYDLELRCTSIDESKCSICPHTHSPGRLVPCCHLPNLHALRRI